MSRSRGGREKTRARLSLLLLIPKVSRPLCAAAVVITIIGGLLPPAFNITTGLLAGSVPAAIGRGFDSPEGTRVVSLLVLTTVIYVLMHMAAPIRDTLGDILMRRVDGMLGTEVMRAAYSTPGIAHL